MSPAPSKKKRHNKMDGRQVYFKNGQFY
jgi:hypothetical protein